MAETVSAYQQSAFTSPASGETKDPAVVLGNDNNVRSKHNSHDADGGIHLQSSALASRPAAASGNTGWKWLSSDGLRLYYSTGSAWSEIQYLSLAAGGTVAGATTFSAGITATTGTFSGAVRNETYEAVAGHTGFAIGALSGTRRIQYRVADATFLALTDGNSAANIELAALTATTGTFSGAVSSSSASGGVGYATGAGGAVTQLTNKSTGVTLNTVAGQITTSSSNLDGGDEVTFTVTNSRVAATDTVVVSIQSGPLVGVYIASVSAVAAGSFNITLSNLGASEAVALVLNFAVLKAVAA